MKIALCGSAGTGRSYIARLLSQELKIPLISGVAKNIACNEKYDYHSGITVEKFLATPQLQVKILNKRQELELQHDSFVTDRSWVDQAAYAIIELNKNKKFNVKDYVDDCHRRAMDFDIIAYVPWNDTGLENDGIRTLNLWYQFVVDSVITNLLNMWQLSYIKIPDGSDSRSACDLIVELVSGRC